MKKLLFLLALSFITIGTYAQHEVKNEVKTKKTTTVGQKFHNAFSKHKHYSGTKTKHIVKKEKHVDVRG